VIDLDELRAGWARAIAVRDEAPEDCPCREATELLVRDWLAFAGQRCRPTLESVRRQWEALREVRRIQSGMGGGDPLEGEAVLDVRERAEFAAAPRADAANVPVSEIDSDNVAIDWIRTWAAGRPIVVYCRAGIRSARIVRILRAAGLTARNGHELLTCAGPQPIKHSEASLWE
jgi:rhodanese-related sulfurtransferase